MVPARVLAAAKELVTDGLDDFFEAEIVNERDGGHSPATLDSALDSLQQGGLDVFDMLHPTDLVRYLTIVRMVGWNTEIGELVR